MRSIEIKKEDFCDFVNGEAKCLNFYFEDGIYFLWRNYLNARYDYISLDRFYPQYEYNEELKKSKKLPKFGNYQKAQAVKAIESLLSTSLNADLRLG